MTVQLETSAIRTRGADLLVRTLVAAGVRHVFGVPGDTGVVLYDAFHAMQGRIQHVLARDERHAAYMADGYARSTGGVGVCEASSGGGVSYLASGLGEAFASSIPVLAITSDIHRGSRGTGALTEIDQQAVFAGVTKATFTVDAADEIPRMVAEALARARSGRPAPVALIVPEDLLAERVSGNIADMPPEQVSGQARATGLDQAPVAEAARLLSQARRPAIVAGGGVHLAGAYDALAALADVAAAPVATSIHGKGAIGERSRWSLGVVGANGAREEANRLVADADVVLFVGTRCNATDTNSFTVPPRGATKVIQIDIDPVRTGHNYPGSLALVGDAADLLNALVTAVTPASAEVRDARAAEVAQVLRNWQSRSNQPASPPDGMLESREVVRVLHAALGPDTFVVADPGTPTPNIASYWPANGGARRVVVPRGHGPMGYALPAAIGVAVANPSQRVLCLTTEGSLAMSAGDWETAVRLRLPITYVLLDNSSMGWIKMLQHLYEGGRYFGVDPGPIDAVGVATAMGMVAHHADSLEQLKELVEQASASEGPALIETYIPDQISSPPPVAPWQATLAGELDERPVY
jgi:acetolactate synthase-1/2/3 large subunit